MDLNMQTLSLEESGAERAKGMEGWKLWPCEPQSGGAPSQGGPWTRGGETEAPAHSHTPSTPCSVYSCPYRCCLPFLTCPRQQWRVLVAPGPVWQGQLFSSPDQSPTER